MQHTDDSLRERVNCAWQRGADEKALSFEHTWAAADKRYARARRRYRNVASVAAVIAVVAIAMNWQPPTEETTYIEIAELLESTSWTAPSDVLLPNREIDIYQDMPVLFESTDPAGGALL